MKKKALVLLTLLCMISFGGCSDQSHPEDVIQKMEDAFNEHDLDKMVEC